MRRAGAIVILVILAVVFPVAGQTPNEELQRRIAAAEGSQQPDVLIRAASAARLLGDFDAAEDLLERATTSLDQVEDSWISEMIFQAIASGRGVDGMQRAFRRVRERIRMTPQEIAVVMSDYPSLLRGGEYDEMILVLPLFWWVAGHARRPSG